MKIVHALAYYGDYIGGIQLYVKQLAERQKEEGHEVKIITSDLYGKQKVINNIPIIRSKALFSAFRVPFTISMPYYMLKEKCDVLHVHLPLPWLDLNAALKKVLSPKTKLVVTIHNYVPAKSRIAKFFALIHNKFLIQTALRKADIITVPSLAFANSLPYKLSKKEVIPYAIDTGKFYPSKKYDENQILFVGRLIPEKGLHILMKAMQLVRKKIPKAKLLAICAETYDYKNYEKEIKKLDDGFLEIKKNVPNNKIRDYYANSAAFIMPSLDIDSFGIVLLEAMACGCPVIVSDLPGPSSLVKKDCGLIVPKGNEIKLAEAIIQTLKKNGRMRNNARKYVEDNFSWGKVYKKFQEVYSR
jgi:glycosyltransferase involved in cell wall biosynthesis